MILNILPTCRARKHGKSWSLEVSRPSKQGRLTWKHLGSYGDLASLLRSLVTRHPDLLLTIEQQNGITITDLLLRFDETILTLHALLESRQT